MQPQFSSRVRRTPRKVANQIRRYRLRLGLTQREVARRLGVPTSTYSAWEQGVTWPSLRNAARLDRTLGIMVQGLYPELFFRSWQTEDLTGRAA